jgi:polysaccharide biosynthesis protein PelA
MRSALLILLALLAACQTRQEAPPAPLPEYQTQNWVLYYNDELPAEAFLGYDLIVFDDAAHPSLQPLLDAEKTVLGYLSLGESGASRPFAVHETPGLKLEPNPNWEGNFILDVSRPEWTEFLLNEQIPAILAQGFHGLMLDTADSPLWLAWSQPEKYGHLHMATVDLIRKIRARFPEIVLMLNRGFDTAQKKSILAEVAPSLDYILAESTVSDWDAETGTGRPQNPEVENTVLQFLHQARRRNPALQIVALDYWDPADACGSRAVYEAQRRQGYLPLVSTVKLDKLHPEPPAEGCET